MIHLAAGHTMRQSIGAIGYRFGMVAVSATLAYDVAQIAQVAGLLRFPADEILIYGSSLCIVVPFVLEMLALHHVAAPEQRFWTQGALLFAVLYAAFVTPNYVVQLATVVPAKLRGEVETLGILEQTPHSLFWDYDAMGYIAMGIASALLVPAFSRHGAERWARNACLANALVTPLISVVYFYPRYSTTLLFLGFPWAVTAPLFMYLIARLLRARQKP